MIDQILSTLQGPLGDVLKQNGLSASQVPQAASMAGASVKEGLIGQLAGGNLQNVIGLFTGGSGQIASNPAVTAIAQQFSGQLIEKLGLQSGPATQIAQAAIPFVVSAITEKFQSSGQSADAAGMASFLGADAGNVVTNVAKNLLGGKLGGLFG